MPELGRQTIRPVGVYGVIRQAEVDDVLIPEGAVTEAVNVHFDKKGAGIVRPGITNLGGTAVYTDGTANNAQIFFRAGGGNPCVGLYNHRSSLLIAVFAASGTYGTLKFYRLSISNNTWVNWQTISPFSFSTTGTAKVRFAELNGNAIAMYGTESSQSIGFVFTGNADFAGVSNFMNTFPSSDVDVMATSNLVEVFKSKVYIAGTYSHPNRLYYSSVVDKDGKPLQGALTWAPTVDFVDINPSDGEDITSIKRYSLELVIFKPNYMYRFRTSGLDPDPLIRIGTRSHESVVEGKSGLYFHSENGFFKYSGGYPEEISRAISDIVKAIPVTQYSNVVGWKDEDHIYWSLGNITLSNSQDSTLIKNCVIRYTESSEIWTIYSYPNDVRRAVTYVTNNRSSMSIALGLDNGSIATFNRGTTDIGEPISYRVITKWYEWGGIETIKTISKLMVISEKRNGMSLFYQTDENTDWQSVGQLTGLTTIFKKNCPSKFQRLRFKIAGVTTSESSIFNGIEVLEGIINGKAT